MLRKDLETQLRRLKNWKKIAIHEDFDTDYLEYSLCMKYIRRLLEEHPDADYINYTDHIIKDYIKEDMDRALIEINELSDICRELLEIEDMEQIRNCMAKINMCTEYLHLLNKLFLRGVY